MTEPESPDDEDRVLRHIGSTLLALQRTEYAICRCLHRVSEPRPADEMLEQLIKQDRRTLGMFIRHLQSRVEVFPTFEKVLKTLLKERNLFVHRLQNEDWFDLSTADGRRRVKQFLLGIQKGCLEVNHLLGGFLLADAVARGIDIADVTSHPDYLSSMQTFLPLIAPKSSDETGHPPGAGG